LPQSLSLRPVALAFACALLAVVLASCGGSGSGSSSTGSANAQGTNAQGAQQRRGFGGFANDPKVKACLQKQGVTLPARRNPPPAGGGTPPAGGGTPPAGGRRPGQNGAQFQKLRNALKACGVTLPAPGQGGPAGPPPAANSQTQTTS
jgi:hypothetical protein